MEGEQMIVGYRHWQMVSTDSAGVPHGGRYGDVPRWERQAKRHGLKLGWSRLSKCFGIYTQIGPGKYAFQLRLWNERTQCPIALTPQLLQTLVWLWERNSSTTDFALLRQLAEMQADYKRRVMKEEYEAAKDISKDVATMTYRDLGMETKPLISIPRIVRAHGVDKQHIGRAPRL